MIYEIDKYTDVLCKFNITPNQFYIAWLLYTKDYNNIKKYIKENGHFKKEDFDELLKRDLIMDIDPKDKSLSNTKYHVTEIFAEAVLIEPEDAWDEFVSAYPAHLIVQNTKIPAKGLTMTDEQACITAYTNIIKRNKFLHRRIINAITTWKENNGGYATIKIDKFITSKYWEEIEKNQDNEQRPRIY